MSISGHSTGAPETPIHLPSSPSLPWRIASSTTVFGVGFVARLFIYGLNNTTVNGLDKFLDVLQDRADPQTRKRGLVTVSNHIAVIDEPLIWGVIPLSFSLRYLRENHRWSFGAHDIVFKNAFICSFFTLGRTLPTVRLAHSPNNGGLFQPTLTEGIRLLSKITPDPTPTTPLPTYYRSTHSPTHYIDCTDPFSETPLVYSPFPPTMPSRHYLAPSLYTSNSYSWIHIFPEGMTHQTPQNHMRYFKWGVSRLILEPETCPDLVPMFVEGTDGVMHESRKWPRFVPRAGKNLVVTFGDKVDVEERFGDLRARWQGLVAREQKKLEKASADKQQQRLGLGLLNDFLMYGDEAVALRIECARRVREEVLKVRKSRGWDDDDPKAGWAETWMKEGPKREGKMDDKTWVRDV